jgi:uncharacterized protein involved in exopolysaccharide biosynthesis
MDHAPKPARIRISTAPPPPVQPQDDDLDVLSVFRLVRRRIGLIAVLTLLLVLAMLPSILSIERTYTSQTRILVQRPLSAQLFGSGPTSLGMLDLTTELERLAARGIAERVIADFDLAGLEEFNPPPKPRSFVSQTIDSLKALLLSTSGSSGGVAGERDVEDIVVRNFFAALTIRRSGLTNVVEVGFTSRDPQLAAQIPDAIIRAYLDDIAMQNRARLENAGNVLRIRIDNQQWRVAEADRAAQDFRLANGASASGFQTLQTEAVVRISTLSGRQSEIERELASIGSTLTAIQSAATLSEKADFVVTERMAQLKSAYQTQQGELTKMLRTYGDSYAAVVAQRESIAETEAAMEAEVARLVQSLQTSVAALDRETEAVTSGIAEARASLTAIANAEAEYRQMLERLEDERETLSTLEEQHRMLENEATQPVVEVEILSPASVSPFPNGRSRTFYLMVAAVVASMAAVTVAVILEVLDQSIRSQQQVAQLPGAVAVGLVPLLPNRRIRRLPDRILNRGGRSFYDAVRGVFLVLDRDRTSPQARSILVTSAVPHEGKTVMSMALAMQFAADRSPVLLVDADLRYGHVHKGFQSPGEPGLADFLSGQMDIDKVIHRDAATGIDYIPRGANPTRPYADVNRLNAILDYAKDRYRTVVFDCPPVLATNEIAQVAEIVDRTLMVVRWGRTKRKLVELAIDKLRSATGEDVLVTLSQVNPKRLMLYGYKDSGVFSSELRKYHA